MNDAPKFAFALIFFGIVCLLGCAGSSAFLSMMEIPAPARPWLWAVPYILLMAGALLIGWAVWEIGVNGIERVNYSRADVLAAKREETQARNAIIPGVSDDFLSEWIGLSDAAPYPQRRYGDGSRERVMAALIIADMCQRGLAIMTPNRGAQWASGWKASDVATELNIPLPTSGNGRNGIFTGARTLE